eukprot:3133285-Pyramimonas_sp.AAC.1
MERTIRLRLVLRNYTGLEAFDVETFSETARRSSQRLLASAAACKKQWVIASLDINMAFLQGLIYQELAEATGEKGTCGVFYSAVWIGHSASNASRIRTLRRVKALPAVLETRHGHQRRTAGFPTKAHKDH